MTSMHPNMTDPIRRLYSDTVGAYANVLGGPGPDVPPGNPVALPTALNEMTVEDAYRFQEKVISGLIEEWPSTPVGYKISVTSKADQALIGATEPTCGVLTDKHLKQSGTSIELDLANNPLVEAELIIRVMSDIPASASVDELARSVECAAGIEVPVSRFAHWWPAGQAPNLTLSGLIADNSVAGFVVVGARWATLSAAEIEGLEVRLETPTGESATGVATNVLGHPLNALSWLARNLAETGRTLPAGSIVSSGTFFSPRRATLGTFSADFGNRLGTVTVDFTHTELFASSASRKEQQ